MALTVNLAVALWGVVLQRFTSRRRELSDAADRLALSEFIDEQLSIEELRKTIKWRLGGVEVVWWVGLSVGLLSVVFLYTLMWHGYPLWDRWCSRTALLWAAYTSPALMTAMTLAGYLGISVANRRLSKIQTLDETRRREGGRRVGDARDKYGAALEKSEDP